MKKVESSIMLKEPDSSLRQKKARHDVLKNWQLYLMVLPALLYIIIFAYKPMYGVLMAFQEFKIKKGIAGSKWVGFAQFDRLFSSYWFPVALKNTLRISLLSLLIGFPAPIILALLVNEIGNLKAKKLFQTVSYAPHFISTVVVCSMITLFLNPTSGIINVIIKFFGGEPVYFMQKAQAFPWIYVISGVWQGVGWGTIIYFAALSSVDKGLLEAAEIDGANRIQKIIHINLPALKPTIVIMLILSCGSLLGVGYEKVYLLQTSPNTVTSEVLSTYVYKVGLQQNNYSFSTAAGLFNNVVNIVMLIITNTIAKRFSESSLF